MKHIVSHVTHKRKKFIIAANWLVVLLYMAVIFTFSSQNGVQSNKISESIVRDVKEHVTLPKVVHEKTRLFRLDYNFLLRKATHFLEYFLLALLFYRALIMSNAGVRESIICAFMLCLFYACLDEYHQSFVTARTPRIRDVAIDASGAALAMVVARISIAFAAKRQKAID